MKYNSKKRKVIFRYFTIVDFEEEEIFLRKQHQQGYRLAKFVLPGFYYFEPCKPEDMIYQLDFSDISISEKPDYLQIFRDYGWEYLFDFSGWSYFRKPANSTSGMEGNNTIFSDMESKLLLLEKVHHRRLLPIVLTLFFAIICQIISITGLLLEWKSSGMGFSWWTITGTHGNAFTFLFFITFFSFAIFSELWLLLHCWRGFKKLKKKYLKN